jgi:NAD+ synthase (glutamine-hydrolysing)
VVILSLKVTIAQLNPYIGDLEGNSNKIIRTLNSLKNTSDLIVFPELFLVGYPPRDLLEKSGFISKTQKIINKLVETSVQYPNTGILLGAPLLTNKRHGKNLYNSGILICNGRIVGYQHKSILSTYDVFDEARYFEPTGDIHIVQFKNQRLGISICEDGWNTPKIWRRHHYQIDPMEILARKGATLFINLSASPFYIEKEKIRYKIFSNYAKKYKIPLIFVNQVGANDELIFDGRSMVFDNKGRLVKIFHPFKEHVETVDLTSLSPCTYHPQPIVESIYEALILGIRDYMRKCGFSKAVVGLSGGIDSAVTCCLAKEAIGRENVLGVSMPSLFSSKESIDHTKKLASNLGIDLKIVPITPIYEAYIEVLTKPLEIGSEIDITLENIQARIRGNILMAFSNKYGYLVLSTGNKSELAVGYCTLYGDMTGGLAVISDVPKTMIYKLAYYINRKLEIIPKEIIEKAPTAELRPNQKDQDTLPPYEILDKILYYYVDKGYSLDQILALGLDSKAIHWVVQAVNRNEYKRRQAPPGLKISEKAFGMGRRMMIAAKYEHV